MPAPHTQISQIPAVGNDDFPSLTTIERDDLVGPLAANRQPSELSTRDETLRDRANKLLEDMNWLFGKDENGSNTTADGNPQYLPRDGSAPLLADIDAGGNKITNLNTGTNNKDAVRFDQLGSYLLIDGSRAMTGSLQMGDNKVTDVNTPTADKDAANKKYVDDTVSDSKPRVPTAVTFSAPGSYVWTIPDWARYAKAIVTGGGAAGADSPGSAGGTAIGFVDLANLKSNGTNTINVTVGDSVQSGGSSFDGKSAFGSFVSATGAEPPSNVGPTGTSPIVISGGPGSGASGDILISGGSGANDASWEGGYEEANGGASYWGTGPAYGGGGNAHQAQSVGHGPGNGVVYVEVYA